MNSIHINGLQNFGNSCYFNSSIQLIKPIIDGLSNQMIDIDTQHLEDYYHTYTNSNNLRKKYIDICHKLHSNGAQMDCGESLRIILDNLGNKAKYNFSVKFKNVLSCNNCNLHYILNEEREEIDSVLISNALNNVRNNKLINFSNFLRSVLEKEPTQDTQYCLKEFKNYHKKCKCCTDHIVKQVVLTDMPKYLLIDTQRTNFSIYGSKSSSCLQIAKNFQITTPANLKKKCEKNDSENIINSYDLSGIIVHYGSIDGGHFFSYVKENNIWYKCNDNKISKIIDFNPNVEDIQSNCCILLYIKN